MIKKLLTFGLNSLLFLLLFSCTTWAVYCPIPQDNRIYNQTGSQCVFCSLESIGRFCKDERLYDLTSIYKGTSGPGQINQLLTNRGVPFQQTQNKKEGYKLLEQSTKNSIPAMIGIYGTHAIVVVHYDPLANRASIIDNVDRDLRIKEITVTKLNSMMDGWTLILYPGSRHKINDNITIKMYCLNDEK